MIELHERARSLLDSAIREGITVEEQLTNLFHGKIDKK
jgi:hypothetical protein